MPRNSQGRFVSQAELDAEQEAEREASNTNNTNLSNERNTAMTATDTVEIEFVDELPKVTRGTRESGVWVDRLAPLRDNPGKWARVFGPTPAPHAQVNNLKQGNAGGIDPDEFEFAGRMFPTGETDEEGKAIKEGYVYAKFLTDEERAERDAALAEADAEAAE